MLLGRGGGKTMTMMRWDPFGEAMSLRQAMDRLLEEASVQPARAAGGQGGSGVALDVIEHGEELVVKASLPGVEPEDVNITIEENVLTVEGEAREEYETPRGQQTTAGQQGTTAQQTNGGGRMQGGQQTSQPRYHHRERRYGRFMRQVVLPMPVDAARAQASFEHGVLTITLPKAEHARRRQIKVGGAGSGQLQSGQAGDQSVAQASTGSESNGSRSSAGRSNR
jgi:HSP20 family protein